MNTQLRTVLGLALVPLGAAIFLGSVPASAAAQLTFPGCGTTLQQCIDDADPGSTISVGQDVVNESISITKSLTLQGAPTFRPRINQLTIETASPTQLTVAVRSFEVGASAEVQLGKGSGHRISLLRLKVDGDSTGSAVVLDSSVSASMYVVRSVIHASGDQAADIATVTTLVPGAAVHVRLIGNRIDQRRNPSGYSGITFQRMGAGVLRADVMNNVIWDVGRCLCGSAAGMDINVAGNAMSDFNVVGNTIAALRVGGVVVSNDLQPTGHLSFDAFNNILTKSSGSAIDFESATPSTATYRAGNNDEFANLFPDFLPGLNPGTGNVQLNARFVDLAKGNFGLLATSPVIDRGIVCSPGGVADPDAAGNHRLAGKSVDMGALERGAKAPTGIVRVAPRSGEVLKGTRGADILCGTRGHDFLVGNNGNDYLDGAAGPDLLIGGKGNDTLFGRAGRDELCAKDGLRGNDRLDGGPGSDGSTADPADVRKSVERSATCDLPQD